MIDVKNEKVNEVIQEIHEVVQKRKVKKEHLIKEEAVCLHCCARMPVWSLQNVQLH